MFKFIKGMFRKKEHSIETISSKNIQEWFNEKTKHIEEELKEYEDTFRKNILNRIGEARYAIKQLSEAELLNPKITTRELQFMDGNRRSYIQRTEIFLKQVEGILDHNLNFFLTNYDEYISEFGKSTARSYHILQEFFSHETKEVAARIKDIDKAVEELRNNDKAMQFEKVDSIKKEIIILGNRTKKEQEIKSEIKRLKSEQVQLNKEKEEKKNEKERLLLSKEYASLSEYEKKKQDFENEIKRLNDELSSLFSSLERPLRKYQRVTLEHEKIIERYLAEPMPALMSDVNFKIIVVLETISKNILEKKLEFKEKESRKALDIIARHDEKYFTELVRDYINAMTNKERIDKELHKFTVKSAIDAINEKIEDITIKEKNVEGRIKDSEDELNSINLSNLKEKIRKDIENELNIELKFEE